MSLKVFHFIFIAASILLAVGCGAWALVHYSAEGGQTYLLFAGGSLVSLIGLVFYGNYVRKKLKDMPYL